MLKAIIDLGTNTFNLLVAEVEGDSIRIIHSEKRPVMLGMGGINAGLISDDAFDRGLVALDEFTQKARDFNAESIVGIGTSALREARNKDQFISEAKRIFNLDISVVHGLKEAHLIYQGVKACVDDLSDALIMDIGGGSTEFILCDKEGVKQMESYNIGVSRMFQLLNSPKDYTPDNLERVRRFIHEQTKSSIHQMESKRLIGSSGTFETFFEMIQKSEFLSDNKAVRFDLKDLKEVVDWSIHSSWSDRKNHPHIVVMRRRMLPLAALKVEWIMQRFDIDEVWISPYSLKEGALLTNPSDF